MGQIVEPFLLESNPSPGNEGNRGKPQGERLLRLIAKGEVEKNGICPVVIVTGKKDLLHPGEGNF